MTRNTDDKEKQQSAMPAATSVVDVDPEVMSDRVTIYENEVWCRVRIGPFNDIKKLNNVRVLLSKNNINAISLKVKSKNK